MEEKLENLERNGIDPAALQKRPSAMKQSLLSSSGRLISGGAAAGLDASDDVDRLRRLALCTAA